MRLNLLIVAIVVVYFLLGGSISSLSLMAWSALLVIVAVIGYHLLKSN